MARLLAVEAPLRWYRPPAILNLNNLISHLPNTMKSLEKIIPASFQLKHEQKICSITVPSCLFASQYDSKSQNLLLIKKVGKEIIHSLTNLSHSLLSWPSQPAHPITLDWTLDLGLWLAPAVQISNWIWEMAQFYNHWQPGMERERLLTNNHVTLPRWLHIVGFPPHAGCWWCHWPH